MGRVYLNSLFSPNFGHACDPSMGFPCVMLFHVLLRSTYIVTSRTFPPIMYIQTGNRAIFSARSRDTSGCKHWVFASLFSYFFPLFTRELVFVVFPEVRSDAFWRNTGTFWTSRAKENVVLMQELEDRLCRRDVTSFQV